MFPILVNYNDILDQIQQSELFFIEKVLTYAFLKLFSDLFFRGAVAQFLLLGISIFT